MCCRFVLVSLLMCVAHNKADNFHECSEFFYKSKWPKVFEQSKLSTTFKFLCQRYKNVDYYATLYVTKYKIPLFSAYLLDNGVCHYFKRPINWFIETEMSSTESKFEMGAEHNKHDMMKLQAVNEDYQYTGFDRGHLNPSSYHCDVESKSFGRTATYTLTNAVPQDPYFNRNRWKVMEIKAKAVMHELCNFQGAKSFFVTGVIPSTEFIPFPEHDVDGRLKRDYHRVNVPSGMWTAACCDFGKTESFSFSYMGQNGPYSTMSVMPISSLLFFLRLHGFGGTVQIFDDNCFDKNKKSERALKMLNKFTESINAKSRANLYINLKLNYPIKS